MSGPFQSIIRTLFHVALSRVTVAATYGFALSALGLSAASAAATPITPILVTIGGFSSCAGSVTPYTSEIYPPFAGLLSVLNTNSNSRPAEWIIACHTRTNYGMKFYSSRDPEHMLAGNADALIAEIKLLAGRHPDSHEVFIVGHSYGGWAAMFTTINLPNWINVGQLTTIDPISAENCSPYTFISAYLGSMQGASPAPGCSEAPSDLGPWYGNITARVKTWRNYFQTQYLYLHSNYVNSAYSNTELAYTTPYLLEYQAHQMMDKDDRIWSELRQAYAE